MQNRHFEKLKNKWTEKHRELSSKLYETHRDALDWVIQNVPDTQKLAAGSLAGLLYFASPSAGPALSHISFASQKQTPVGNEKLIQDLKEEVPDTVEPLVSDSEQRISQLLTKDFGFRVVADIGGKRLDRTFGLIGAEQHLPRYPGDIAENHSDFIDSGITPGRGAWGYFASSAETLTQKDIEREKYYIAVQTFLADGFSQRVAEYRDFFKYRKMLVVNPETGQAVVADIADAGPAPFTGKHLGGSPEVMYSLGLHLGPRKGAVLFFFIDDPNDTIPLGPIGIKS